MAELVIEADLALGAPGASSLERCCLGLPALHLVLAENQRENAERLDELGAALSVDEAGLHSALDALIEDEQRRLVMCAAAAGVTDGTGAETLASTMFGADGGAKPSLLRIRPATPNDSEALWLWRNDPDTRGASRSSAPVSWPEHQAWFEDALASPNRHVYVGEREQEPVAMVRFDAIAASEAAYAVSINIRPTARGGGGGRTALAQACRAFLNRMGPVRLEAEIRRDNQTSRNIFETLGFRCIGTLGDSGFDRYVCAAAPAA